MGTEDLDGKIVRNSIAGALQESYNIVRTVLESQGTARADLPNMHKIKAAFELGRTSRKVSLCDQVFDCATKDFDIALPDNARTKQVDCDGLNQVCPGVSYKSMEIQTGRLIIQSYLCQPIKAAAHNKNTFIISRGPKLKRYPDKIRDIVAVLDCLRPL